MSVFKRNGVWWIDLYLGPVQRRLRRSLGTRDRETAVALAGALELAHKGNVGRDNILGIVDQIMGTSDVAHGIRLVDAWGVYAGLPVVEGLAVRTVRLRRQHWQRFVDFCSRDWPSVEYLAQVTRWTALAYTDELREACDKAKTFNNHKGDLSAVTSSLMIRGGLSENVWKLIPNLRQTDSLHGRAFTAEEEGRILAAARLAGNGWFEACVVARYTGLRYVDIATLRWDDVHGSHLFVRPSKTKAHGISVMVPLHDRVREALGNMSRSGEYVLPWHAENYGSSKKSPFSDILELAQVSDESAHVTFHCWRHTFRTRLSEAGVRKDVAQKLGGWTTDISEVYNHDYESMADAIRRLS